MKKGCRFNGQYYRKAAALFVWKGVIRFFVCLGKQHPVAVSPVQNIHHRMGIDAPAAVQRTIILERIRFRTGEIQTNQPFLEG